MRASRLLIATVGVLGSSWLAAAADEPATASDQLCFPDGFLMGSATASYQVEGGWNEGGRTPSIWDEFCRAHDIACANVADDFYHRYMDDIQLMVQTGLKSFRFSVSWSRVMNWDATTKRMKPNAPGIAFYHAVIDELKRNNITPVLTIYHWDLPTELETQLSPPGWLTADIHSHFVDFATLLFTEYGSKVDYWTTFNEPLSFTMLGYGTNQLLHFAPGLEGSDRYQYTVAHNVLLSHAKAVQKFRELKAQNVVHSNARIAIVIVGDHTLPLDPSNPADVAAAERTQQFYMGWFLEPIVSGDYPAIMRERVGDRLPRFTPEESALVKDSYDIFNVNYYNTHLATSCDSPNSKVPCDKLGLGWERDMGVDNNGKPVGARNASIDADGTQLCGYFSAFPEGYRQMIRWVHEHNPKTEILLTENGYCGNSEIDNQDQLWYHQTHLEQVHKALVEDKIPIIGYTAWSFMDNYEWGSFKPRFGLYYVNYTAQVGSHDSWTPKSTDLARVPRPAAKWFAQVAKSGCMTPWKAAAPASPAVATSAPVVATTAPVSVSQPASTSHAWRTFWIVGFVVILAPIVFFVLAIIRRRLAGTARERSPLLRQ